MTATESLVCAECGARPKDAADRYCAYCGTELPREPTAAERRLDDRRARFEAARRSAGYDAAMRRAPSAAGAVGGNVAQVVFLGFFMAVALSIGGFGCAMTQAAGGFPGHGGGAFKGFASIFVLVPVGMALFALVAIVRTGGRAARVATSETRPRLALVRDERQHVSGGGGDSSASTRYHVTFEYESGEREEYPVPARLAGRVARDDVGVAYERGGALIDFTRLDV